MLFKAERLIHLYDNLMEFVSTDKTCFLSIVRDCHSVYASQKRTKFPESDKFMSRNPVQTALNWRTHVKKALRMSKEGRLEMIKYEDLILNTEEIFSQLLEKTGISFFELSQRSGDLFDRLPESHKSLHVNILEKPILKKTENWKRSLSLKEQCMIKVIAGNNLSMFGQSSHKQVCPILTWSLLGYYFLEYLFYKLIRIMQFYLKINFNN